MGDFIAAHPVWAALIPAISALAGALIGSLSSVIVSAIQVRAETKRQLVRLAAEIELEQIKALVATLRANVSVNLGNSSQAIVARYKLLEQLMKHGPNHPTVRSLIEEANTSNLP